MDKQSVNRTANDITTAPQVQHIRFVDLPDPEPENYKKSEFTECMLNLKAGRTVREFAADTGLSESFISKALNGFVERPPSKRTMLKLLSAKCNGLVDRRELLISAGYAADQIDWDNIDDESTARRKLSASEEISQYYGESVFIACGYLTKILAEHGLNGEISSCFHRDEGYFEVKDEDSGQVFVGINLYCKPGTNEENAVLSMIFSLALTYNKVLKTDNVKEKVIIIMTNNEKIFDGCQTLNFEQLPKSTMVALFTNDHTKVQREAVLSGKPYISLLELCRRDRTVSKQILR